MIAGHHRDLNARCLTGRDRIFRVGTQRIDHPYEAEENEVAEMISRE